MKKTQASSPVLGTNQIQGLIAVLALAAILLHLILRFGMGVSVSVGWLSPADWPLVLALVLGGEPLLLGLAVKLVRGEFGSDLLAGVSIATSILLGEYLAGTVVVLMLAGGEALEGFAVRRASFALEGLARRLPALAHRHREGNTEDVALDEIQVGDMVVVFPHETCPVDGVVLEGRSTMNESYLTGEPYLLPKATGSAVLSGAINGDGALTIRAEKTAVDSRYAKIMQVMRDSEQRRPQLRRLGDQLGAMYTPLAIVIALFAWAFSGRRMRSIALQSAVGGMGLSMIGMLIAALGYLPPVAGAVTQEVIDVLAVLNALRAYMTPRVLSDYGATQSR